MTRTILEIARDLQQHVAANSAALTVDEERLHEIGRFQATQLIDALRMGEKATGLLMCAIWAIQKQQNDIIFRGFIEECQECLAQVPR